MSELSQNVTKLLDEIKTFSSHDKNMFMLEVFKRHYNMLEVKEFVDLFCTTFGVSAMAAVPMAGAVPAAAQQEAEVQKPAEPTEFNVILASAPADKKIAVIKVVRALTNLGLKEAKDMVEAAPKPVKEKVPKEEAEKIKKELETAGAVVEVKGV